MTKHTITRRQAYAIIDSEWRKSWRCRRAPKATVRMVDLVMDHWNDSARLWRGSSQTQQELHRKLARNVRADPKFVAIPWIMILQILLPIIINLIIRRLWPTGDTRPMTIET